MPSKTTILSELCHLDYDAVSAYEAALERIDKVELRAKIGEFRDDHRAHITHLNKLLVQNGEEEVTGTDLKKVLTKGKVVIAGLVGEEAVLKAMNINEKVTTEAYEKALKNDELTAAERSVLEQHYADEKRHKSWFSNIAAQY